MIRPACSTALEGSLSGVPVLGISCPLCLPLALAPGANLPPSTYGGIALSLSPAPQTKRSGCHKDLLLMVFPPPFLSVSMPKLSATSPVLRGPACLVQGMRWSTTLFSPTSSILSWKPGLLKTFFMPARSTALLAVRKPPPMVSLPALVPSPKYLALTLHLPLRGGLYPCPHR
jgi:hypothetical protein